MRRLCLVSMFAAALFAACSSETLALRDFTPPELAFGWRYTGALDYTAKYTLQSRIEDGGDILYGVLAEVEDLSGGESDHGADHFNVQLKYILSDDALVQEWQRAPMMDAEFQRIELLRKPLKQGARWTQEQYDSLDELVMIDCEITNLISNEFGAILDVTYTSRDGKRQEYRRFENGRGMTLYEKIWETEFPMGFRLEY